MSMKIRGIAVVVSLSLLAASIHAAEQDRDRDRDVARQLITLVAGNGPIGDCPTPGSGEVAFPLIRSPFEGGSDGPFIVPPGKVLIITDASWRAFIDQPGGPNVGAVAVLEVVNQFAGRFGSAASLYVSGTVGTNGVAGGFGGLTAGSAIPEGDQICGYVSPRPVGPVPNVTVHGYLIDKR